MRLRETSGVRCVGRISVLALLAGMSSAAWAQSPDPKLAAADKAATAAPAADDTIVVTGSRIARDGSTAPTPVTVLSADYMNQRGQTNVADALNELPSFRPAQTPAGSSNRSQLAGSNFVDLRGLGSSRTLTLVDGKRYVPSAGTGQVDLNLIPSILIARTEVVTGGASASYGSDAVAGVVNLILKKDYVGVEGDLQSGVSQLGDNGEVRVSLHAGSTAFGGRLHFSVAGEYVNNGGVGDQYTRAWGRQQPGLVVNPSPATNGLPTRIITTNVHDSLMTDGGLITGGLTYGSLTGTTDNRLIQFSANGTPIPFTVGQLAGSQLMIGGDGASYFYRGFNLLPKIERGVGYGRIAFDATDNLRLFTDVTYARSEVNGQSATAYNYGNLTISQDNAFLPAAVKAAMVAAGRSTVSFGRWNGDLGPVLSQTTTDTKRVVAGFEGKFGSGWSYDGYYEYGRTNYVSLLKNSRQQALFRNAIDAVVNPANGQIVCRVTLTNPNSGCTPFNPFGIGQNPASAQAYFSGTQRLEQVTEENVVAGNIQGPLFDLPAGPLSVAVGGEYRKESANANSDAASQANLWEYGNPKPLHGSYNVKEAYGEVSIPVFANAAFAKRLDVTGAFRYTDYSTSGGVSTWKVGGDWEVIDGVRFRATRSRDIRAPNISELFTPSRLGPTTLRDPITGNSYFMNVITSGNSGLKPEKANTFTGGVVLTPLRGLRMAVDYFNINIKSAISTLAPQDILDRCSKGETALCALIERGSNNVVTSVFNRYINVANIKTEGLDIEFGYQMPLSDISSLPGDVSLRTFATYTIKSTQSDGVVVTRLDGQAVNNVASTPKWVANTNLTYEVGALSVLLQGRFISAGKYDLRYVEGVDINNNHIPSRFYLNLSGQVTVRDTGTRKIQFFGVVNNLLDKDPPLVPVYGTGATNFAYYDVIGRSFKVGVRFGL